MRCVKCDAEMVYFQRSESNNWLPSHWRCPECNYSETEGWRVDVEISNEPYIPKKSFGKKRKNNFKSSLVHNFTYHKG
jgi:hypothetical protein